MDSPSCSGAMSVSSQDSMNEVADIDCATPLSFDTSWNEGQQTVLKDNLKYYRQMTAVTLNVMARGNRYQQIPEKPKTSLNQLLKPNALKPAMTPIELHNMLAKEVVMQARTRWAPYMGRSWQDTEQTLMEGIEFIKSEENKMLSYYLAYGKALNNAYLLHKTNMRTIGKPWKQWLSEKIGIQDSYARKLRSLQKELAPYPKFQRLGLSYSWVYKHFTLIKVMLLDDDIANFWKEA